MNEMIERIVREVMARLGGESSGVVACAAPKTQGDCPVFPSAARENGTVPLAVSQSPACDPTELVLSGRLITLGDVEDRLGAIRRLIVPVGAVVTPAVRDELDRRRIVLGHARPTAAKNNGLETKSQSGRKLMAVIHAGCCDPSAITRALVGAQATVSMETDDCVIAASDRLQAAVKRADTLGALVTKHAPAALCLLNRLPQVRAIAGQDLARLGRDAASVGANVLVIDVDAVGVHRTGRLLGEFSRLGAKPCPRVFGTRLN